MEVINKDEVSLSNAEVLQFLREESKEAPKRPKLKQGSLATLRLEILTSLESGTSSALLDRVLDESNAVTLQAFRDRLKPFKLSATEELTVLNACPTRPVEVHLIVENSEERLKEDDVQGICDIVKEMLGQEDQEEEEEEGEQEEMSS